MGRPHHQQRRLCIALRPEGPPYSGTRDGDQCFCGVTREPNAVKVAESFCNFPCADPTVAGEVCGGATAFSIPYAEILESTQP